MASRLGLDRVNEYAVLQAAAVAGLAPQPLGCEPKRGLLLTRYLPASPWRPSDLRDPARLRALGRLLRRVHSLPGVGQRFDPAAITRRYARQAPGSESDALVREAASLSATLYPAGYEARLCHHDAHAGNIVGQRPARLLDWEYAAAGQPWMDLAVVTRFHRLGKSRLETLVAAWLDADTGDALPFRESVPDAMTRIGEYARLYDIMTSLWERVLRS